MTRVADTSVLYALFDEDDAYHARAKRELSDPEPIEVPTEILVETIDLVAYRSDTQTAAAALGWLIERPNVTIADQVHARAVHGLHEAAGGALSLADAFVVQTCRVLGTRPLAFDDGILEHATDGPP